MKEAATLPSPLAEEGGPKGRGEGCLVTPDKQSAIRGLALVRCRVKPGMTSLPPTHSHFTLKGEGEDFRRHSKAPRP